MLFTRVPVSFVCGGLGYILHHPARGVACNPSDLGVGLVENFPSDYASLASPSSPRIFLRKVNIIDFPLQARFNMT